MKNLLLELKRLESGLKFLREQAWREFEESLDLDELGLTDALSEQLNSTLPNHKTTELKCPSPLTHCFTSDHCSKNAAAFSACRRFR